LAPLKSQNASSFCVSAKLEVVPKFQIKAKEKTRFVIEGNMKMRFGLWI